jgi:hypothetical protein
MNTASPSTPAAGETVIIYAAIKLSSTNWLLAIQALDRQKVSRHQMPAGDSAKLIVRLEQARARIQGDTNP